MYTFWNCFAKAPLQYIHLKHCVVLHKTAQREVTSATLVSIKKLAVFMGHRHRSCLSASAKFGVFLFVFKLFGENPSVQPCPAFTILVTLNVLILK